MYFKKISYFFGVFLLVAVFLINFSFSAIGYVPPLSVEKMLQWMVH
jgi:hypothetical protein